mgnify:CR=1 FL=1
MTTPEKTAEKAAEALAATGQPVTARAVREKAGVRMAVAAAAAKAWNKTAAAEEAHTIPMPDAVQARAQGLWETALTVARTQFDTERDGWNSRLAAAEHEQQELSTLVEELENDLEKALLQTKDCEDAARTSEALHAAGTSQLRESLARTEGELAAVKAERDRLLAERDALQGKLDAVPASTSPRKTTPRKPRATTPATTKAKGSPTKTA